jgi:hypothetical protein
LVLREKRDQTGTTPVLNRLAFTLLHTALYLHQQTCVRCFFFIVIIKVF